MPADQLIGALIRGALGGGKKRSRRAARFLTGGRGSFLNASTLLTMAGLAWGAYEAARPKTTVAGPLGGTGATTPPPVPQDVAGGSDVNSETLRLVRLTISAARADSELGPKEMESILAKAREAGGEELVRQELDHPHPLADILQGVRDAKHREDLYVLAFTIVRADEEISGAERIYLAQLAHQLGLDPETAARLQRETVAGIERQSEETATDDNPNA